MRNISIILLLLIFLGCSKTISESNRKKVTELNKEALKYSMNNDLEKAKTLFSKALNIDSANISIRNQLIGIYIQQDSLLKAFEILENTPKKQKNTQFFFHTMGIIYERNNQRNKAIENYQKALELTKIPSKISNDLDLSELVNYAMLETFSGKKNQAVNRINKALKLDWLTESNIEYLETFRNEFEFYQGNGFDEFDSEDKFYIKTTNEDSLMLILKNNHINVSESRSISNSDFKNDSTELFISKKYLKVINKLGIKVYSDKLE